MNNESCLLRMLTQDEKNKEKNIHRYASNILYLYQVREGDQD
jgi:hypothetical protein